MFKVSMFGAARQRVGGHGRRGPSLQHLLAMMFQSKTVLALLNVFAILFLISSNQTTTYWTDYNLDMGVTVPSRDSAGDPLRSSPVAPPACPDPPPMTAASTASTTAIVEKNDNQLHKTATVMAMATGYNIRDYQRFVGSLRKTGYEGNIILVVAPNIGQREESYLLEKNVIMHKVQYVNCSHPVNEQLDKSDKSKLDSHQKELITCVHPYPKLKHRWARFPLLRDLLRECGGQADPAQKCGGPVLITDMRDAFFQRNPFGPEAPKVYGLQVFEEHYTIRTTHWLVNWPVGDCKGVHYDEPMLCSGTTIGTRQAMLDYLEIFHGEMNLWMESPKCCCFDTNGDDQSMHNYLYYSGMLQGVSGGVQAVKNRNGLVHTVGALGSLIHNTHKDQKNILRKARGQPEDGHNDPYDISSEEDTSKSQNWLGLHYGLTDREGYFVDYDGSRSFVVHQYDRFGFQFIDWMDDHKETLYMP